MTDPLHTEPVVTQADVHAAALQWCGEKDRETSLDDVRYFENNWQSLPGLRSRVEAFARHRTATESASLAREDALRAERDFLLARASKAGSCSFGGGRWTGLSSNALVTVAFGGEDDCLPSDSSDLAACYRTMLRLPRHLLSDKVWEQLEDGERYVGSKYPDDIAWAKEAAEWPEAARAALSAADKETPA